MKRFNKILCVVDPDKDFDSAVVQTVKIAKDHQADVTFVAVVSVSRSWRLTAFLKKEESTEDQRDLLEIKREAIESRISAIAPSVKPNIEVVSGIGFIEIIKFVIHQGHDLVVKCAEDSDWLNRLFESEDMHILRKCPCPVLMLKPGQNDSFRNILATVDVNEDFDEAEMGRVQEQLNKQVLEYSAAFALPELSYLHIGSAWDAYAEDYYRSGAFARLPEDKVNQYVELVRRDCTDKLNLLVKEMDSMFGKDLMQFLLPRVHLVKGRPAKELPLMADSNDIDLIVMGTVGRVGIPGLFIGNTAESILEQVKCSVLAIKPDGFKTPVK